MCTTTEPDLRDDVQPMLKFKVHLGRVDIFHMTLSAKGLSFILFIYLYKLQTNRYIIGLDCIICLEHTC